jgi:hypothetical protein
MNNEILLLREATYHKTYDAEEELESKELWVEDEITDRSIKIYE